MNCNTIYCSNATTNDTQVILVPNRTIRVLENTRCYRLIICCNATATSNLPVFIQVGTTNIPVLCKAGNTVYANQLQKRKNYSIMYGNENSGYVNGQFVIQDRICPRSAEFTATQTTSGDTTNDTNNNMRKEK